MRREQQGAEHHRVMSDWTFDTHDDLAAVLRLEFPAGVVDTWLAANPGATSISYGYQVFAIGS